MRNHFTPMLSPQPFETLGYDGSDYWLAYPEARRNSKKIRAFRDFLLNTMPGPDDGRDRA